MTEPLIDLSNPEAWRLLKHARKRGYLTRDEFDRMVGPELAPESLHALRRELWKLHISILVPGNKR